ncbi:MAG: glycosyltransferase family 9 protein [Deltaproteobacteria bacterium]|nr:glycosyltransferase family 9 protein [Deltaproteobacteria bacterium]
MSVDLLQRADRLVFTAGCFLLTLVRRLVPEPDAGEAPHPRALLFVRLAEQGSTVLAARAIRRAIAWVGRENVYFLVFEENRFILDVLGLVPEQNVFTVPTRSLGAMISGTLAALRRIRALGIDAAVDLEFFARFSATITWLSGARWRAGMHAYFAEGPYRGDLFTYRVLYNAHVHTGEMFLAVVEALSRPARELPTLPWLAAAAAEPEPMFQPSREESEKVERLVREVTASTQRPALVLLNANASDLLPLRRWPAARYAELAARLLERLPEAHVVFTGHASETDASAELVRSVGSPRCHSLAGRTTLRELLVLYTLADLLVTNDSGPAHFATLTPISVVTLFGPETPKLFAARTPRNSIVFAGLACSPCVNALNNRQTTCRRNECMTAISVDQVLDAALRAYASRRRAPAS